MNAVVPASLARGMMSKMFKRSRAIWLLNRGACLLAIRRGQRGVRPVDRRSQARNRREQRPAAGGLEGRLGRSAFQNFLESVYAVFLKRAAQVRQDVAIIEDAVARAHDPAGRKLIGQAEARADIVRVLPERLEQMLEVVTQLQVHRQVWRHRPVILQECASAGHRVAGDGPDGGRAPNRRRRVQSPDTAGVLENHARARNPIRVRNTAQQILVHEIKDPRNGMGIIRALGQSRPLCRLPVTPK
jgi:hypothetical protein